MYAANNNIADAYEYIWLWVHFLNDIPFLQQPHKPLMPEELQVLVTVAKQISQRTGTEDGNPSSPEDNIVQEGKPRASVSASEVEIYKDKIDDLETKVHVKDSPGYPSVQNNTNIQVSNFPNSRPNNSTDIAERHYKMKPVNKPAVVLYAKYRTGSTFASAFINYHPTYFFTYEPLHLAEPRTLGKSQNYWISETLNCRFQELHDVWMNSKRFPKYKSLWKRRTFCFKYNESRTCAMRPINELERDCASYSLTGTKVILVSSISTLRPLMEQGVKVIHLVRDPRGVINSIFKLSNFRKANNTTVLFGLYKQRRKEVLSRLQQKCSEIREDLKYVNTQLQSENDCTNGPCIRQQYHLVRYEDLATDPHKELDRMYSFLGQPPTRELSEWIDDWHGRARGDRQMTQRPESVYGTYRNNSTATAFGWRYSTPWDIISQAQSQCRNVLRDLGYNLFVDEVDLIDSTVPTLVKEPKLYNIARWCHIPK